MITKRQHIIAILWPSFVVAAMVNGLFFAAFDPSLLLNQLGLIIDSRLAGYSIGFFFFWGLGICTAISTILFIQPVTHNRNNS